jgi:hypothetical protein
MLSYAISFHAAPGLEMIRFACAIFRDGRMDQRVRRAAPLIFTQQFPDGALLLPAQAARKVNAALTWKWNLEVQSFCLAMHNFLKSSWSRFFGLVDGGLGSHNGAVLQNLFCSQTSTF